VKEGFSYYSLQKISKKGQYVPMYSGIQLINPAWDSRFWI